MGPENRHRLPDKQVPVDVVPLQPEPAVLAGSRVVAEHKKLVGLEVELEPILLQDLAWTGPHVDGTDVVGVAEHPQVFHADVGG